MAKARIARGRRPQAARDNAYLQKQADRIASDNLHPEAAVEKGMEHMAWRCRCNVYGTYFLAHDLEDMTFADELLDSLYLRISFAVTHIRPPKSAWGAYVVLLTFSRSAMRTACAPQRHLL